MLSVPTAAPMKQAAYGLGPGTCPAISSKPSGPGSDASAVSQPWAPTAQSFVKSVSVTPLPPAPPPSCLGSISCALFRVLVNSSLHVYPLYADTQTAHLIPSKHQLLQMNNCSSPSYGLATPFLSIIFHTASYRRTGEPPLYSCGWCLSFSHQYFGFLIGYIWALMGQGEGVGWGDGQ